MSCILKQHNALRSGAGCDPDDCPLCGWDSEEAKRRMDALQRGQKLHVREIPVVGGQKSASAKLTWSIVRQIRSIRRPCVSAIAKHYGVTEDTIRNVLNGKTWKEGK